MNFIFDALKVPFMKDFFDICGSMNFDSNVLSVMLLAEKPVYITYKVIFERL